MNPEKSLYQSPGTVVLRRQTHVHFKRLNWNMTRKASTYWIAYGHPFTSSSLISCQITCTIAIWHPKTFRLYISPPAFNLHLISAHFLNISRFFCVCYNLFVLISVLRCASAVILPLTDSYWLNISFFFLFRRAVVTFYSPKLYYTCCPTWQAKETGNLLTCSCGFSTLSLTSFGEIIVPYILCLRIRFIGAAVAHP